MKFEKGHKLSKGRPLGSHNKRTVAFFETIQAEGFDPAKAILELYEESKRSLEFCNREERPLYIKLALDAAKEIASYCYPKLKSVEHVKPNKFDELSNEERLALAREAIKVLELEAAKDESS